MSNVHFDTPKTDATDVDDVKEVIAMQGATIIAAKFVEKVTGWFAGKGTSEKPEDQIETELLKHLIKEIKTALLDK